MYLTSCSLAESVGVKCTVGTSTAPGKLLLLVPANIDTNEPNAVYFKDRDSDIMINLHLNVVQKEY